MGLYYASINSNHSFYNIFFSFIDYLKKYLFVLIQLINPMVAVLNVCKLISPFSDKNQLLMIHCERTYKTSFYYFNRTHNF